jgi:hypothetical protein
LNFADFDRLSKLEKRGDEIKKKSFSSFRGEDLNVIFYKNMPNLHNRYISAERKISQKNPEYMLNYFLPCSCSVSDSPALHSRSPLLLKIEISSNGQNCSILSQNVLKFELYKHNDEWLEVGITGHKFGRGPSKNHFSKV